MMAQWGVNTDAGAFLQEGERGCAEERRKAAALFKRQVVRPAIAEAERKWAGEQYEKLIGNQPQRPYPVPYEKLLRDAAIPRGYPMSLRWACWGPAHWKWYRRWLLARMGCPGLAAAVGTRGPRAIDDGECSYCGRGAAAGMSHWVLDCEGTRDIREEYEANGGVCGSDKKEDGLLWAFESRCPPEVLQKKVRLVGRIMGRLGLVRNRSPEVVPDPSEGKVRKLEESDVKRRPSGQAL